MEEMHRARYGEGHRVYTLSLGVSLPLNLHVFTSPEALQTLSFWGFMGASLHRHD